MLSHAVNLTRIEQVVVARAETEEETVSKGFYATVNH